uniref:Uncharacterized protein n=1 Tax=Magallana gigas TaxID=29159 RepID=K1PUH8_MAGGI
MCIGHYGLDHTSPEVWCWLCNNSFPRCCTTLQCHQVLIGVMDKDETTIGGVIDIVNEYHKYLPLKPNGPPLTLPLHADGLSCGSMVPRMSA